MIRRATRKVAVIPAAESETDGGPRPNPLPSVSLTLPLPPSVNAMFRNVPGRGRVKTSDYLDWIGHAGWVLRQQKPAHIAGPYITVIAIERPTAGSDIDNRIKAIHDLLVKHGVTDDDRYLVGSCLAWAPPASNLAHVMVLPAANYAFSFQLAADRRSGGFFLASPDGARDAGAFAPSLQEDRTWL